MIEAAKRLALNSYKVCDDIDTRKIHGFKPPIQQSKRARIKIAVIDDQPFEAGSLLRNYGYAIEEKGDVKKLSEIEEYPIILCDLMNVGMFFDTDAQGASLIKEIRRNYPAKYIAAYSGASATSTQAQKAKQHADTFIKKDSEIESWVEKLDDLISEATDPRNVWLRTRAAMIAENIDTKTILLLEDAYVKSIQSPIPDLSRVRKIINEENIASAAKNIVLGLASSAIFEALK
ncbi:response regulator [Paracoccus ravus]|uniref:response regulator n=1 Tax=Paracoccus ravus TaxID=2447760 RepID=UPI00106F082D|nr:response regulator [Paracoccus ravus]